MADFVNIIFNWDGEKQEIVKNNSVFLDIKPCSPLKVNRRFGGTLGSACYLLHVGFLLGFLFEYEDGDMFHRNVG
jgi:hypothetical protein